VKIEAVKNVDEEEQADVEILAEESGCFVQIVFFLRETLLPVPARK